MRADKTQVTRLLKTARGQIDGLLKMVEEDRYCSDISNQLLAVEALIRKANREVLPPICATVYRRLWMREMPRVKSRSW